METRKYEITPPYPRVEVRLPNNGGVIKGQLKTMMRQPGENLWLEVTVPTWTRWRTQIEVGAPAREGIGPGEDDIWVPSYAVTADTDDLRRLRATYDQHIRDAANP